MERSRVGSKEKSKRKFNSRMQAKLLLVFCVVSIFLFALVGRLVYITKVNGASYSKKVLSRATYKKAEIPYQRGEILDRTGTVLARSELHYKVVIDPKRLLEYKDNTEPTIKALEKNFEISSDRIREILVNKPNSRYSVVATNITYEAKANFEELMEEKDSKIVAVWFEKEYVRVYPYGSLASDVIGFTSTDNTGYWGIEEYYNSQLNGVNGREYAFYDSTLNVDRVMKEAVNGNHIISTIDANAQRIIEKHIKLFDEDIGSKSIAILAMDPNSGEILAMASNHQFDLNNPRDLTGVVEQTELDAMTEEQRLDSLNLLWRNDVISNSVEVGSTFKPVTVAAALEEGLISHDDTFLCDGGEMINGKWVACSKKEGHGVLTLSEVIMKSCNDGLMQIVNKLGKNSFHQYQHKFGFGEKTGLDLPGEANGILFSLESLGPLELATSSFGQAFTANMIQLAAAYSSTVNGGYLYQPHIVKEIKNDKGAVIQKNEPIVIRRTMSEETSDFLQKALYQTVEAGTAKGANVEGYAIGGKTGTAQKVPYTENKFIVSFIGQVPAVNPELVLYVMIDEPQNVVKQADSSIATKFTGRIMKELLPALGIFPDGDIDYLLEQPEDVGITNTPPSEGNTTPEGNVTPKPPETEETNSETANPSESEEQNSRPPAGTEESATPEEGEGGESDDLPEDNIAGNEDNEEQETGNQDENEDDFEEAVMPEGIDSLLPNDAQSPDSNNGNNE